VVVANVDIVSVSVSSNADDEKPPPTPVVVVDSSVVENVLRVKKFMFDGVKYLKDTSGTIYDFASQERIGVWSDDDKKIVLDAKEDEEDECSEEEYEE